jgi:hypothetical protein
MKKRFGLIFVIGFMVSLAGMQASMIPCADTSLSSLIALGSGPGNGCTVDDKIFNNFSYVPGGGAPVASLVTAHLDANTPTLTYGWLFGSLTGAFAGNFALGYTVTVDPALDPALCPTCTITSTESQLFPGTAPPGAQAFSIAESAGPTPVLLDNLTFGGNTNGSLISPGVTTLTQIATSSGITGSQPLLSLQMDVRQSSTVIPEPAMLPLMGIGLLGLGLKGRRRAQK